MLVKCPSKHICFMQSDLVDYGKSKWFEACAGVTHVTRNQFSLIFWDKGAWRTIKNCTQYVHQHMTARIYTSMTPRVFRNTLFISKDQRWNQRGWTNGHGKTSGYNWYIYFKKKYDMIPFNIFWMCHCFPCRAQEGCKNACKDTQTGSLQSENLV